MSDLKIDLKAFIDWLRSEMDLLGCFGVSLAGIRERQALVPAVVADFDTDVTIGRVSAWVSGEVDFEVLLRSDGSDVSNHHEMVSDLESPALRIAYRNFIHQMANHDLDGRSSCRCSYDYIRLCALATQFTGDAED